MNRAELEIESSMLNWYPKVKDILPTPKTIMLRLSGREHTQLWGMLDGKPLTKTTKNQILIHAHQIGFPLFMRSDMGSGKHDWQDTCFVEKEEDLLTHLYSLVEWHACCDFFGKDFSALAFRELLPLQSEFTAFAGMPVSVERRYFVRDGEVICGHPYWPEAAIRGYNLPADWKDRLARMNTETEDEICLLAVMAAKFSRVIPGYWSVDFAKSRDETRGYEGWYFIDAARGEISWHPDDCPHKPKDSGKGK